MSAHHHHPRKRSSSRNRPKKTGPRREHIEELHPTDEVPDIEGFDAWELNEEIQRAIRNMDITKPTPIQALAIGPVLEGKDVIAKAETGTGKTLAFGAPMMSNMDVARSTVLGLVLCPTRELAQQVADVLKALGLPRGLQVALVVGGDPMQPQIAQLHAGAQVVVGTPGRVLDLYEQRFLSFPWTEVAILDEADKMFEIGFLDDIKKILSFLPDERQTLLFSATFPTEVLKLARESTKDPVELATKRGPATVPSIDQFHIKINSEDRPLALTRLLEQSDEKDVFLVFCERRTDVDRLLRRMERLPFEIKALHGGYDQPSRYRVMSAYRTGEVKALLATDVASRGLDVNHVTHVINFGVPRELEDYTHRIGRTGRAGRHGTAITFVPVEDARRWKSLVNAATWEIPEMEAPDRHRRGGRPRPARSTNTERDAGQARPEREERPRREREDEPRRERSERPRREREERPRRERDERPRQERAEREERPRRERDERPERTRRERSREDEAPRGRSSSTGDAPLSRWARASDEEIARRKAERQRERAQGEPREEQRSRAPRSESPERQDERPRREARQGRDPEERSERPRRSRGRERAERDERPRSPRRESSPERSDKPTERSDERTGRSGERSDQPTGRSDERPQRDGRDRERARSNRRDERPREEPRRERKPTRPAPEAEAPGFGTLDPESKPAKRAPAPKPAPKQPAPEPERKPEPPTPKGPAFGTGL